MNWFYWVLVGIFLVAGLVSVRKASDPNYVARMAKSTGPGGYAVSAILDAILIFGLLIVGGVL